MDWKNDCSKTDLTISYLPGSSRADREIPSKKIKPLDLGEESCLHLSNFVKAKNDFFPLSLFLNEMELVRKLWFLFLTQDGTVVF